MVSVTSASRYISLASRYHPRYQSRSSMYIRGLIPWNFAELVEAVLIDCLLLLPLFWGSVFGFCFVMQCFVFFLVLHSS